MDRDNINRMLREKGQLQLLRYVDELGEEEREDLYRQIEKIDFSLLDVLKHKDENIVKGRLEPIKAVTVHDIQAKARLYYDAGIRALKEGKVAAVLLAGGQGTRLGFDKPKGVLNVGLTKELYLFQILIQNLMNVVEQADAWVPLLIMTSDKNHGETVDFFEEKEFFGYNKDYVVFFKQEMAPSVDFGGRIFLEERHKVSLSPNGNGGWFASMLHAGILDKMKAWGVEWFNVFSVDNVLQKMADPYFVGAVMEEGYVSGSKVVAKADPDERVGVMCLEDGRPSIIEYYEMTEEMKGLKDEEGNCLYNYGVILNYLLNVSKLEEMLNNQLPLHVVEKKIPHIGNDGDFIKPDKPNGYKFETLILDMIRWMDNCLPYEVVRNAEFAPIKNKEGVDSLESARELLKRNGFDI